ncbi:MAG: Hsp20/alpha crystallin family protein [Bacteroidales bacterium]|nr:Hsp20/alpha crystallin family protein [Bacteroidales bacterium]
MLPSRRINQNWLPDIWSDFFDNDWMHRTNATAPAVNVLETDKAYTLELAAPGMTREDFKVGLDHDGNLTIHMERKAENKKEEKGHYLRREFSYSEFQQTLLLPDDVEREHIGAKMENGVLTVNIPKVARVKAEDTNRPIDIQ